MTYCTGKIVLQDCKLKSPLAVCLYLLTQDCCMSRVPVGLEDVSKFPNLFAELIRRGYSDEDVEKVARLNLIRVLQAVENVHIGSV